MFTGESKVIVTVHAMKAWEGEEVKLHSILTSLLFNWYWGLSSQCVKLTHLHLVLRLSAPVTVLPMYAFMLWTGTILPLPWCK